jgi:hypothetical protein
MQEREGGTLRGCLGYFNVDESLLTLSLGWFLVGWCGLLPRANQVKFPAVDVVKKAVLALDIVQVNIGVDVVGLDLKEGAE